MAKRLMESVPNFSEGRDRKKIDAIVDAIASVEGVEVLHVDAGEGANRTVVTFVGEPEAVVEGAFQGARKAQEVIDMREHHGEHPRIGATDVLPLVPISGISLEECAEMARALSARMAHELGIPVYCYEAAAYRPEHSNLALCRKGEYEGLAERLCGAGDGPDFGDRPWDDVMARSGASVVGARNFLIAVNFNLNTRNKDIAQDIACDVRQKGRLLRDEDGNPLLDEKGQKQWIPGALKGVKAIGWYIDEYGIAQVSMNICDIEASPLHMAYEQVCKSAREHGVDVTGTEIIGLVPRRCILDAGKHFLGDDAASEEILIKAAIRHMGLDDLRPFNPSEKLIG